MMKLLNIKSIALLMSLALLSIAKVSAQSCSNVSTTTTVTNSCTGSIIWTGGSLSIGSSSSGSVTVTSGADTVNGNGALGSFNNTSNGSIYSTGGSAYGLRFANGTSVGNFTNAGLISVSNSSSQGIHNLGAITLLTNSGSIVAGSTSAGIVNVIGSGIATLLNTSTGSISGGAGGLGGIWNGSSTIGTLTNLGVINAGAGSYGINNAAGGVITTLNNAQGGNSSSAQTTALTMTGTLPTNYNIIISSPTYYGQLAVTGGSGTTTFGIYGGGIAGVAASTLNKGTYSSVLSGVASSNLTGATSGNYNGFTWRLNNSSGSIWDLIVTGASTADTQQSLVNTASALQNTFTLQNTVLANSFTYDCNVFGANNVCVSAGGRNTQVSAANGLNNTSALLIAAYRVMPSVRIGAYADQNLSVNNAGSTVNLGNNTPLIGLFGAWNERLDGTGTEVKVSAAYGQKNTTVTRQVVGTSEAGSGSSQLNSQGAQLTAKYGFGVTPDVLVSPYVGMRYTQNNMNGYTEGASSSVTAPLTYSALNTNATTALAGVGASYRFIPQATVFASAGVETDTNTSNGTYSATGITGLTPINFNANPVKTRPTATVGAYYDVEKNQRVGITGIYRQEPYQAVQTTTVMATYTVGL